MKKLLLATTVLAASAGYASAEITWAGSAEMGISDNGTEGIGAGTGWTSYSGAALDITMSGSSDSGLTFGATFSLGAGTHFDGLDDGIGSDDGTLGAPEVYVSGSFGRIAMNKDGYNHYHNDDDDDDADVEYTGTFGALSVGVRADIEEGDTSANLGYTAGSLTLGANMDDTGEWDASISYAMGQVTLGASVNDANETTVTVDYDNGAGMTAGIEIDSNDAWTLSGGYSANALSVNAEINSDDEWEVTGSYDLGGGLSIEGGVDNDNDMFVGAAMTF